MVGLPNGWEPQPTEKAFLTDECLWILDITDLESYTSSNLFCAYNNKVNLLVTIQEGEDKNTELYNIHYRYNFSTKYFWCYDNFKLTNL